MWLICIRRWFVLTALAATASAAVSRGGHGNPGAQPPSDSELQQGHHRQLSHQVTPHTQLNDIKETQQIQNRKHDIKRELRKKNRAKHSKVHHDKKKHKKHHKKSHKCHGEHHKEAVIPVETTTPLDLFAKLTPISFEGSGHFLIVGRSGESFWDVPEETTKTDEKRKTSTEKTRPLSKETTANEGSSEETTTEAGSSEDTTTVEELSTESNLPKLPNSINSDEMFISDDGRDGTIKVQWLEPDDNAVPIDKYIVKVIDASGTQVDGKNIPASSTNIEFANLEEGKEYTISVVAVSADGGESPPTVLQHTVHGGSYPVPAKDVEIDKDGHGGLIVTRPVDSNDKVVVEAKLKNGTVIPLELNDAGQIQLDGIVDPEEIRVYTEGDGGKKSDVDIRKYPDIPKILPINIKDNMFISDDERDGTIKLQWLEPDDNAVPIDNYIVKVIDASGTQVDGIDIDASDKSIKFENLQEGKEYNISVVAVSADGGKSRPTILQHTVHGGSYPVPAKDVVIERDGPNGFFVNELDSNDKVVIEVPAEDGGWKEFKFDDVTENILMDNPKKLRVYTVGDRGKKSDVNIRNFEDLPFRRNCSSSQNMVARCKKDCDRATCLSNSSSCSNDLTACSRDIDEQFCDCDSDKGYIWEIHPETSKCIKKDECVQCDNGRMHTCKPCEDDTCDIAWEKSKYCKISTENCDDSEVHCKCDNDNGWYWDVSSTLCVKKEVCLENIKCPIEGTTPRCKISEVPTCDNADRISPFTRKPDHPKCKEKPECACADQRFISRDYTRCVKIYDCSKWHFVDLVMNFSAEKWKRTNECGFFPSMSTKEFGV